MSVLWFLSVVTQNNSKRSSHVLMNCGRVTSLPPCSSSAKHTHAHTYVQNSHAMRNSSYAYYYLHQSAPCLPSTLAVRADHEFEHGRPAGSVNIPAFFSTAQGMQVNPEFVNQVQYSTIIISAKACLSINRMRCTAVMLSSGTVLSSTSAVSCGRCHITTVITYVMAD